MGLSFGGGNGAVNGPVLEQRDMSVFFLSLRTAGVSGGGIRSTDGGWRSTDGGWPMTHRSHSAAGALRRFECTGGRRFFCFES